MSASIHTLIAALQDDTQERHAYYKELANQAEEIEYSQAAKLFRAMIAAEKARLKLYARSLASLETHRDEHYDYHICPQCGYAVGDEVPVKCPICDTQGSQFERIS